MNFLKSNFWEIDRSTSLQNFGAILSFLHIFNYFFWQSKAHIFASQNATPLLCWSILPHCELNPLLLYPTIVSFLFSAYLVAAIFSLLFFIWRRYMGLSWFFLAITNFVMMFFYLSDASLSQDIYSLFLVLNFTFLFVPGKALIIRSAVVIFYFVSGLRELNPETLSGVRLHEWIGYPYKILEWVAAISVAIKVTLPALLLSPIGQRLALAVIGLFSYHAFYFYYFNDFKSLVLIGLILFFIFDYFAKKRLELETLYQSYAHPEPSRLWWMVVVGLYALIQTPIFGKNPTDRLLYITEPLQLNECLLTTFVNFKSHFEHIENDFNHNLTGPTRCHPVIAFNSAREICKNYSNSNNFISLNATFGSRHLSQTKSQLIFSYENICDKDVKFQMTKAIK